MLIAFWVFMGLLVYSYFVYPALLAVASLFAGRKHRVDDSFLPRVSLIVPAHNEEGVIEEKIRNILALDYPKSKLEVVIASDGSTDKTVALARRFIGEGVSIEDYKVRRGKMGTLNAIVPKTEFEILVLTDANAMFKKDAVRRLVRHFSDSNIGCVCGAKRIVSMKSGIGSGEGLYWRYENFLKKMESRVGSCAGADGSIYALRRELYPFPREDRAIMDDLAVSLKIIERGYRVIFEPSAIALEGASVRVGDEFRRKVRILSGALVAVAFAKRLLVPLRSPVWIQLYSHKVIRWGGGILMLGALLTNIFLLGYFYRTVLALQAVFYLMAFAGFALSIRGRTGGKLYLPFHFVLTNAAQVVGVWKYMTRAEKPAWERLEREPA
jgi:cellulose synthase/poly-beta-1,6-N-acetylglucosamine synthase-like glycosyltransferase